MDNTIVPINTYIGKRDSEIIEQYGEFDYTLESTLKNTYSGGYIIRKDAFSTTYYMIYFIDNVATDVDVYKRT